MSLICHFCSKTYSSPQEWANLSKDLMVRFSNDTIGAVRVCKEHAIASDEDFQKITDGVHAHWQSDLDKAGLTQDKKDDYWKNYRDVRVVGLST